MATQRRHRHTAKDQQREVAPSHQTLRRMRFGEVKLPYPGALGDASMIPAAARALHSMPCSSSSAFSINSSLTTTSRRGTRNSMVEAQASDSAKIAAVSGSVVSE